VRLLRSRKTTTLTDITGLEICSAHAHNITLGLLEDLMRKYALTIQSNR